MAVAVTRLRAACATACAAALPLALALGPAAPFAPPTALAQAAHAPAAAASAAAPAAASAAELGAEGLSGLRLAGPRSAALIDGRWWPLGSMPRGARLVAVHRQQVQLRHLDGRFEVLALNPSVATVPASSRVPSGADEPPHTPDTR